MTPVPGLPTEGHLSASHPQPHTGITGELSNTGAWALPQRFWCNCSGVDAVWALSISKAPGVMLCAAKTENNLK